MAGCGHTSCACILAEGAGISITGSGTVTDPYVINSTVVDLSQFFEVRDTTTVNLSLVGTGTTGDPLILRANSTLRMTQLADVADPGGGPAVGEVPVWVSDISGGHWEFQLPPPSPAGATNVENGLSGIGSAGDPVKVETSGVWGSGPLSGLGGDSTIGSVIYVDANGDLRGAPSTAVAWASITGKPTQFPPTAHTHTVSQITDLSTNGNAARVNGIKIVSSPNSITPPASPAVGDLWFFPEGM